MAAIILLRNRNDTTHKENALVEQRKNGTALVIGAIPPNLKLFPFNRKPLILLVFSAKRFHRGEQQNIPNRR